MTDTPSSWLVVSLGEVIDYGNTTTVQPKDMEPSAHLIELEDIERDTSKLIDIKTVAERNPKSSKNRFVKGQILYGKLRPYLNKVIRVNHDGYCSSEIVTISPGVLDGDFLFYSLKSPVFLEYVKDASHGMGMPRLGTPKAKAAPFLLPPLAEQVFIAKKTKALLEKTSSIKTRIDATLPLLKRFRQTILTKAVSGQLSKDLLKHGDVWTYAKAIDVCEKVQSGGTPKEGFSETGIPFLKVYNIVDQKIDFSQRQQFITNKIHESSSSKSITRPGDVVMNIVGPPLGKIATITDLHPEWNINQAIALFRPSRQIISRWISIVLEGGDNLKKIMHETKGSAGQVNISLSQCRNFVFPLPSIIEQQEICAKVEELFNYADQLEAKLLAIKSRIDSLPNSILSLAFSGELSANWRASNPDLICGKNSAEELLALIKNTRPVVKTSRTRKTGIKKMKSQTSNEGPIKIVDALRKAGTPLTGQRLLDVAGYPSDSSTELLEIFFLDIRAALESQQIIRQYRDSEGQDWFALNDA